MGINIDTTQKTVNGFKKGDTIYININGRNAFETTIGHEIGEAIKSADNNSYTELKNLVKQVFGEQDLTSYQESYTAEDGTMLTDNVEDEWVNDKLGELFENENLRNRIADNRTLLQKVIDNIKSIVNKVTGKDQQKLKTLQQQLEDKFVELYKNTDFSNSNGNTAYGLLDKFKKKNKETINYNISKEFVNEIDYKTRQANKDNKDVKYLSTNTIYDLINNKGNRTIEEEKRLFESIKQNGIKNPIRIANNNGNFEIVDGNHRIEIAKNIGLEEIPVVYDEYFSDVELESDNWYNQLEEKYNAKRNVKVDEETKMNQSTIIGVMKLANTQERMQKVINYIKEYQTIITDHQLRQYMRIILIEELEKM